MAGMPPQGPHANLENPLSAVARRVDQASASVGGAHAPVASTAPPPHTTETPAEGKGYDIYLGTTPGGKTFADSMNAMNRETHPRGKK